MTGVVIRAIAPGGLDTVAEICGRGSEQFNVASFGSHFVEANGLKAAGGLTRGQQIGLHLYSGVMDVSIAVLRDRREVVISCMQVSCFADVGSGFTAADIRVLFSSRLS